MFIDQLYDFDCLQTYFPNQKDDVKLNLLYPNYLFFLLSHLIINQYSLILINKYIS